MSLLRRKLVEPERLAKSSRKDASVIEDRVFCIVANVAREGITDSVMMAAKTCMANDIGLRIVEQEDAYKKTVRSQLDISALLAISTPSAPIEIVPPSQDAAQGCELIIVFGGDGTFLRAAEFARAADVPVFGFNLGHVGFMAEAEGYYVDPIIKDLVAGRYRIEERLTLAVNVWVGDNLIAEGWALNEASIENRSRQGLLELVLEVDHRPVSGYACDGMLISTPTGSTAYAFSAGGPVLWPDLEAILVLPNNAHALFVRPLVISPNSIVAVELERTGQDSIVFCDGRRIISVPAGGRVEVGRSRYGVKWVRIDSRPFADRLVKRFKLPITGWRGFSHRGG